MVHRTQTIKIQIHSHVQRTIRFPLSYQKTLNDIVTTTKKEENKIRAIAALQSIELDIFNIYKQLPEIRIEDVNNNSSNKKNDNA